MYVYHMVLSMEERQTIVRTVLMRQDVLHLPDDSKERLLNLMEMALSFGNLDAYNVRTAFKAAEIWKHSGEKSIDMIMELLETEEIARKFILIEENASHLPVKKRIEIWADTTGYGRASYFKLKDKHRRAAYTANVAIIKEREEIMKAIIEKSGESHETKK
jgi:hypothetical protein